MENSRLREAAPTSVNVTVGRRSREYLTDREVERASSRPPSRTALGIGYDRRASRPNIPTLWAQPTHYRIEHNASC
jgi:hypothetical protein